MSATWIAIVSVVGAVLASELLLWLLFRRKIIGLLFSRTNDVSIFRFFTIARIRFIALMHSVVLSLMVGLSVFVIW